jgi:putative ATPase
VEDEQTGEVPNHLKDSSRDAKGLGHGDGYLYPHAYRNHYVPQQYLPEDMQGTYFYEPSDVGYERTIKERLDYWRSRDEEMDLKRRVQQYGERSPDASSEDSITESSMESDGESDSK